MCEGRPGTSRDRSRCLTGAMIGLQADRKQHVDFLDGNTVQHLIGQYGYGAVLVVVMLESAGIPMPGGG
jgi:hypothetical protein